jgi:nitrite reductase (NAD(P)H)
MAESTNNSAWNDPEANKLPEKVEDLKINGELPTGTGRKRVVVVGLGMVGIAFM